MRTLFVTNVGSHMWNMQRPESDIDLFKCNIAPTRDILSGNMHDHCHFSQTDNIDTQASEIGKTVRMLIAGNVNYIWGVHSPIVVENSEELQELRTLSTPSANCFYSIRGLALHNLNLEKKTKDSKHRKTIYRSIRFGVNILEGKGYRFMKVEEPDIFLEDIQNVLKELEDAKANTKLPEHPENEAKMIEWLVDLRIRELEKR
jgi:predicted nucleotidyltransferase